jgi:hypothetical protein
MTPDIEQDTVPLAPTLVPPGDRAIPTAAPAPAPVPGRPT